jgi:hypothetical protein
VGVHDAIVAEIHDHAERLLRRIDELKLLLLYVRELDPSAGAEWSSSSRDARALAVVCSVAELEALTKFIIQRTHQALNDSALAESDIVPCMRQITSHGMFESLRSLQDSSKVWERRSYVTTLETCGNALELPIFSRGPQPPLDGRTLRPEHFNRMWSIYGLPGIAFPAASWASSLQKLALVRNDIAHGNLPFGEIFQQAGLTVAEVESYIDDLGSFSIHLVSAWTDYLDRGLYLKALVPSNTDPQYALGGDSRGSAMEGT